MRPAAGVAVGACTATGSPKSEGRTNQMLTAALTKNQVSRQGKPVVLNQMRNVQALAPVYLHRYGSTMTGAIGRAPGFRLARHSSCKRICHH